MWRKLVLVVGMGSVALSAASADTQLLGLSFGQPVGTPPATALQLRTIDDDRLFRQSLFGQRVLADVAAASAALEAENQRLLDELTTRELELTRDRETMSPGQFRRAADAFDVQAEGIRRSQADKRQRLVQYQEDEQRRFYQLSGPVLQEVLQELGAQILIDQRAIIVGIPDMDMTSPAISAIDQQVGDGAPAPNPLDVP